MARILFAHNRFPGRFEFLLPALQAQGHQIAAIAQGGSRVPGIDVRFWTNERPNTPGIFDLAVRAETDLMRARAVGATALQLKREGFQPDLIIGHPAWGETLFLKEIFPKAKQVLVGEFYYRSRGADVGFDPEFEQPAIEHGFKVHAKNAVMAMCYAEADLIVCPTAFQASVFPDVFKSRIEIIHEGIDTARTQRIPDAKLRLGGAQVVDGSTPVVTFINRVFEPMRGFHIMMRALPALLAAVPNVRVLMIGDDKTHGYGISAPGGQTWRATLLREVGAKLDPARVHFTGPVPYETLISALSLSWAHVYYTYPFVLSWSLLDAMACECLLLASDTAPVRDAIQPDANGRLNDFFDVDALSQAMIAACQEPQRFAPLRRAARETVVAKFDRATRCLPDWLAAVARYLPNKP